jgi:peptide/nickel transport system substrate-binding protein
MRLRHLLWLAAALLASAPAAAETLTNRAQGRHPGPKTGRQPRRRHRRVTLHMVEGLVAYRENGTVGPLLAEKVELSDDGRTYTFRLRKNLKFHNGAELTAEDAVWSWNRYMDPKTEWRCLSEFDGRGSVKVEAVAAPDPQTVTMRINKPYALFLDSLARSDCGSAAVIHKDSLNPDGSWKAPVGTGPFKFGEWKRGQQITLTRYEGYVSPPARRATGSRA